MKLKYIDEGERAQLLDNTTWTLLHCSQSGLVQRIPGLQNVSTKCSNMKRNPSVNTDTLTLRFQWSEEWTPPCSVWSNGHQTS